MKNNGIHIRISDVIYGLIKHRFLMIVLVIAGLIVGAVASGISYLRGEMSKGYVITSSFAINTQASSGLFTSGHDYPSYNDVDMAMDLADSVAYILKSDRMLDSVIDELGLIGVTTKDIYDNLQLTRYNTTQIIEVTLHWRSAQEGIDILSVINARAPEILLESMNVGNIAVLNQPRSKYIIGGTINVTLWVSMAVLGFCVGIGVVLLELVMHPTLLNPRDFESVFGIEVLCEVPQDKSYFSRKRSLLVEDGETSEVREGLATAAHIIDNRLKTKRSPQIIYATATRQNEGKTSILANLAVQLSDLEKRVLLVDFDLRDPTLATLFLKSVDYDHSLNCAYAGEIEPKEAVLSLTGYLDLLPTVLDSGSMPFDRALFAIVEKLAENYDYVLIDTAPVGITAEPMSLNQIATAAVFVAHYDSASIQEMRSALERVEKSGVSILGCIVNGVQVSQKGIKGPAKEREQMRRAAERERHRAAPVLHVSAEDEEEPAPKKRRHKKGKHAPEPAPAAPEAPAAPTMEELFGADPAPAPAEPAPAYAPPTPAAPAYTPPTPAAPAYAPPTPAAPAYAPPTPAAPAEPAPAPAYIPPAPARPAAPAAPAAPADPQRTTAPTQTLTYVPMQPSVSSGNAMDGYMSLFYDTGAEAAASRPLVKNRREMKREIEALKQANKQAKKDAKRAKKQAKRLR